MVGTAVEHAEILVFELDTQRYALCSSEVRELLRAVTVVPLPRAPAIVEGIINVRGDVVPVLDVRTRFGIRAKPAEHTDHLIVARAGSRLVALRTDRALGLTRVDAGAVASGQSIASGLEYLAGVACLPDGLVLIHDLSTFLSQAEAAALDEALPPREGEIA